MKYKRFMMSLALVLSSMVGCPRAKQVPDGEHWAGPECLANRGCVPRERRVPRCQDDLPAISVAQLIEQAQTLVGRHVRVRGPLDTYPETCTLGECRSGGCCNDCHSALVLRAPGAPDAPVMLRHHMCHGDDSKVCCDFQADRREVVVVGRFAILSLRGGGFSDADPHEPPASYAIEGDSTGGAVICSPE